MSQTFPDGSPSDERSFLVEIERAYDIRITRLENLPGGITDECEEAIWHVEAPFLTRSGTARMPALTAIRQLGARVVLTGTWGDQLMFDDAYLVDLCRAATGVRPGVMSKEY